MQPGDILGGKYRIDRLIGDGGMGTVYEAEHLTLGARVAIKVLHPDLARRPGLGDRFLQEAAGRGADSQPVRGCTSPDVDRTPDGISYLVMEAARRRGAVRRALARASSPGRNRVRVHAAGPSRARSRARARRDSPGI